MGGKSVKLGREKNLIYHITKRQIIANTQVQRFNMDKRTTYAEPCKKKKKNTKYQLIGFLKNAFLDK